MTWNPICRQTQYLVNVAKSYGKKCDGHGPSVTWLKWPLVISNSCAFLGPFACLKRLGASQDAIECCQILRKKTLSREPIYGGVWTTTMSIKYEYFHSRLTCQIETLDSTKPITLRISTLNGHPKYLIYCRYTIQHQPTLTVLWLTGGN
jgi:hypothetical protein